MDFHEGSHTPGLHRLGWLQVSVSVSRSMIEVIAEAMTLAEKNGIQRQSVVQFIETLFPGHIFKGTAAASGSHVTAHAQCKPPPETKGGACASSKQCQRSCADPN